MPKTLTLATALALLVFVSGCEKKSAPPSTPISSGTPIAEIVLLKWQQGNTSQAVNDFAVTDWSRRPLFVPGSALSLTEAQFRDLSEGERQTKSAEMMAQLDSFKKLGSAVAQAGRDAAAKGDSAQARQYFTSLEQCGTALDSPENLQIVKLTGVAFKKLAAAEAAKLGK